MRFLFPTLAKLGWGTQGVGGKHPGVVVRAQVAERLMAADCKSAAPCELRRFESSPVHHDSGQ